MEITWVDRFCFLWGEIFNCLKCFKGVVGRWGQRSEVVQCKRLFLPSWFPKPNFLYMETQTRKFSVYQGDLFYIYIYIYYILYIFVQFMPAFSGNCNWRYSSIHMLYIVPSLKLTFWPWKYAFPKRETVFQPSLFRCDLSFRECIHPYTCQFKVSGTIHATKTADEIRVLKDPFFNRQALPKSFGFLGRKPRTGTGATAWWFWKHRLQVHLKL